jgi:steroid 5-alpha reductase family enzyme
MAFLEIYVLGFAAVLLCVTALWLLSLRISDASIVDIFWGSGFVIVALVYFVLTDGYVGRKWLTLALVSIWGLRLTWHLARRNLGQEEDYRYQAWRRQYGAKWWWWSFFQVFLLQGVILWIVSMPLLAAQSASQPDSFTVLDGLALMVWLVGFFFEAVGDYQLTRFKSDPANEGTVLNTGLWRYTRHPNYFGDAVQWWAFFFLALSTGAWWTVISPVLMTFLLMRVSGVAMLERSLKKRKPAYQDYIERTSAFFPLPPKK